MKMCFLSETFFKSLKVLQIYTPTVQQAFRWLCHSANKLLLTAKLEVTPADARIEAIMQGCPAAIEHPFGSNVGCPETPETPMIATYDILFHPFSFPVFSFSYPILYRRSVERGLASQSAPPMKRPRPFRSRRITRKSCRNIQYFVLKCNNK